MRFFLSIKNFGQYKKLPLDKFEEKRTFSKIFCTMQISLKLQCLVDELVDSLELSMFINASLP